MINFIKEWVNQIIVAVIIATIFEMILPNGNNKKYIKMIIGIYVLFTVIQPIASKVTGDKFEISSFNYEKYFDEDILETSSKNFEDNNSNLIEQAYIDNIKSDVQAKLSQKGYELISCNIEIRSNESQDDYGTIESMILKIKKLEAEEKNKNTNNTIKVEEIDIVIDNDDKAIKESNITDEEKKKIVEYLAEEYSIDKKIIIIN